MDQADESVEENVDKEMSLSVVGPGKDKASQQLPESVKMTHLDEKATNPFGTPMASLTSTLTVGPRGDVLLQDNNMLDHLAHFDRERQPERVARHAKGAGAFGYFEVTADITKYTRAKVFQTLGKKTPVAVRFSTSTGELGSADTVRGTKGYAIKFYTEEGNWDLVGNNSPVFFIRDPILFPSLIHVQKRNPVTNVPDFNMLWDFMTLRPESTHQNMIHFSERGLAATYRHMHGFGINTFKLVNEKMEAVYCKFHMRTDQGIKNFKPEDAKRLVGEDPDYYTRDLYNVIANKEYPSWTLCIQIMTFKQAENFRWNPFDVTKVWPYEDYPLITVGKIVLNENQKNFFAQIEQLAFAPSALVPGIEASPDKVLQGRMFSYIDAQRYRIGANFAQLRVNKPRSMAKTYDRDGSMNYYIPPVGPNYFPNSFSGPDINNRGQQSRYPLAGDVARYNSRDEDNFSQPAIFWKKCLDEKTRQDLVDALANSIQYAIRPIRQRAVFNFTQVNPDFGRMMQEALDKRTTD